MSKHTPEPWFVDALFDTKSSPPQKWYITADSAGMGDIADLYHRRSDDGTLHPKDNAEANAARIVACVNACEGMADPAGEIARLQHEIARLQTKHDLMEGFRDYANEERDEALDALEKAYLILYECRVRPNEGPIGNGGVKLGELIPFVNLLRKHGRLT